MLGSDVGSELHGRGWDVRTPSPTELDVTSRTSIERLRRREFGDADWVVNCTGFTDVDGAESQMMAAMALNAMAPGALAAVCRENGWRLLHVSTDFVFDGKKGSPYLETDAAGPLGVYGKSKLAGEVNALQEAPDSVVVRTSWLFGPKGRSFPRTIIEAALAGRELRVVSDQFGKPTYTADLARQFADLIASSPQGGLFHAAGPDVVSWHGFAVAALTAASEHGLVGRTDVEAVPTSAWPTAAVRPAYSVLDGSKLTSAGVVQAPPLKEALDRFVQRLSFGSSGPF